MIQQFELADAPVRADDDPVALLSGLADSGVVLVAVGPAGATGS